jgi:uncharacterized protein (DUF2236 family)
VRASLVDRLSREGTLLLGGGRAILLQVADPIVGVAAATHSNFADRPINRLHNTLTFVYGVMLGTPAEAAIVAKVTSGVHARIPRANDPERQLWVAATLYDTAVRVFERIHGPIDPVDADLVLASYARLGTALEVPAAAWPSSTAEFHTYWSATVSALEVGPHARQVAHDLFHPATAPLWLRAILPLMNLLTASLLEQSLRDAYGMPWSLAHERRANAAWAVIRAITRVLPQRVLTAPSRRYLARVRAMLSRVS